MGKLAAYTDPTGKIDETELNDQNISNIINELNRNADKLDALNNTLSIIAYGSLTYTWDGSGSGATPTIKVLTVPITSQAQYMGFVYMSRSIDNPPIYLALPYTQAITNASNDSVVSKIFNIGTNSLTGQFEIDLNFYATDTPITYTFYYIIVKQPTNISAS